jgi:hypothetical protein
MLSRKDISDIERAGSQAQADAELMISEGRIGGQLKHGNSIMRGIAIINRLVKHSQSPDHPRKTDKAQKL